MTHGAVQQLRLRSSAKRDRQFYPKPSHSPCISSASATYRMCILNITMFQTWITLAFTLSMSAHPSGADRHIRLAIRALALENQSSKPHPLSIPTEPNACFWSPIECVRTCAGLPDYWRGQLIIAWEHRRISTGMSAMHRRHVASAWGLVEEKGWVNRSSDADVKGVTR